MNRNLLTRRSEGMSTRGSRLCLVSDSMTRVYDIRLESSMRVIFHGLVRTTQEVGKAKIAAEVREDEGTQIDRQML